jgi:general secretion pathway protein E
MSEAAGISFSLAHCNFLQVRRNRVAIGLKDQQPIRVISMSASDQQLAWLYFIAPTVLPRTVLSDSEFLQWLDDVEKTEGAALSLNSQITTTSADPNSNLSVDSDAVSLQTAPVVRQLSWIINKAITQRASDIHLHESASGLSVQLRIDGALLRSEILLDQPHASQLFSRIKVLAGLDIADRTKPQDGRFSVEISNRRVDIRASILPVPSGEHAVLRILDQNTVRAGKSALSLSQLGLGNRTIQIVRRECNAAYGMVLITGPTGSGKSTTVYAVLEETQKQDERVVSIEDPIEYKLPGAVQVGVNEQQGLTFAKGLRAILRHDPDRIFVGEIRDQETASIAVQAAMTGHIVYSTLHANSALLAVDRMLQLGVPKSELVSGLNAVLSQKLVRMICHSCQGDVGMRKACLVCGGSGYFGRRALGEIVVFGASLKQAILSGARVDELQSIISDQPDYESIESQAAILIREGITTEEEVRRVLYVIVTT